MDQGLAMRQLLETKLPAVEKAFHLRPAARWKDRLTRYPTDEFVRQWNDQRGFQIVFRDFIGFVLYALREGSPDPGETHAVSGLEQSIQREFWRFSPCDVLDQATVQREVDEYLDTISSCLGFVPDPTDEWRTACYERRRATRDPDDHSAMDIDLIAPDSHTLVSS